MSRRKKLSVEALRAKIEWEGGYQEALDYGIKAGDIADPDLAAHWKALAATYAAFMKVRARLDRVLFPEDN